MRIKLLGTSTTLTTTPTIVSAAAVDVRIVHDAGGNAGRTITLYENDGTTVVGSMFSNPGTDIILRIKAGQKLKVDTGTDVRATPVGYFS